MVLGYQSGQVTPFVELAQNFGKAGHVMKEV